MIDEAFHPAEAFGEREEMRVLEEAPCAGEIGFQHDRDHSAKGAHLFLRQLVLRMLFEARIINFLDLRLFLEPARNLKRVFAMTLHPQCESLQPAQSEKAIERAGN